MLNRLSGLFVLFLGLTLLALIPQQTESVDYGWLRPWTLPAISAIIIAVAGALHCAIPKGTAAFKLNEGVRALLFLVLALVGLWGMKVFGFLVTAPALMLAIMLAIGERRWLWILSGTILLPAFIWFCIDFLLKRPLP